MHPKYVYGVRLTGYLFRTNKDVIIDILCILIQSILYHRKLNYYIEYTDNKNIQEIYDLVRKVTY